jgi:predicted ATPase
VSQPLYAHSEGNPFFAEELLRNWQEVGVLIRENGQWRLTGADLDTLPESIADR